MREKNKGQGNQAITLISLVITVIIMLILAGVAISLTIGDNGIFQKAKQGSQIYQNAQIAEKNTLEELEKEMGELNEKLPDNTTTTEAGTQVKMPEEWYSTVAAYVSTKDGRVEKQSVKVASVTAIATGNGETIPVPEGFYYVGGTKSSGAVISDDKRDKNKYAGIEDVPTGARYNSDGSVKSYTEEEYEQLTQEEKKEVLLGNQFVWIPVSQEEYKKVDWGKANSNWDNQNNIAESVQIQKYSGFYIARYEAGSSDITLSTGVDFSKQNVATNGAFNDNFSIREGLNHTATGKITTKAGEIPYYYADYFTALELSNRMYSNEYVQSGLVTGTMWDMMTKFIAEGDDTVVTQSTWGNYSNTSGQVSYVEGNGRYATANSSMTSAFTKCDGKYYHGIKTTAISEDVKKEEFI